MVLFAHPVEWILGLILVLSSIGVLVARKPVHASLSFLLTLLTLAVIYLQLSAEFIAVMQVLVYAGAILVLFMFVIVLFQDAHLDIEKYPSKSLPILIFVGCSAFLLMMFGLGKRLLGMAPGHPALPKGYGTVQALGEALYVDFFFPFEAVTLIFLIAAVGALYIGRKAK